MLNCSSSISQIVLKPHIGLNSKPLDSDTACYFAPYTGSFNTTGYQAGDTVNDFTLFSYDGDTLNLRRELERGKPVVLISSSYTCPVYRGKVPLINSLISQFSDSVSIFIIYTIEAHPYPDISPYFGFVNPTQQNINEGILYPLPRNYGARRTMVWKMDSAMTMNAPVFIDGVFDPWLRKFGPAPNNAYLITTQGIVYSKHPWFNKAPLNMTNDINNLFGHAGGGGGQFNGLFNFQLLGDSIVYGIAGETIYGHGRFVNNSNDTAIIRTVRASENLPSGWASSICIDVCYSPETDTAIFYLPPADTQSYTMYFYTTNTPGNGNIRMRFENVNIQSNRFAQRFYASTTLSSVNDPIEFPYEFRLSQNYPNPFNPGTKINYE
ncbi:MAG: hypothetical protein LH629_09750, partial [Ignavibacteria bacterium]|nr:hypothetical protein [Ignavibacteria bacterium]